MKNIMPKEAGNIGKLLIMEFEDNESAVFDDILRLLIVNRGQVITYEQIYQNVWNECVADRENTVISYHIRNLRKKLAAIPNICIRCVREMGYCVEIKAEEM